MPLYQFEAMDAQGLTQNGSVEAADTRAATQILRVRALYVVRLEQPDADDGVLTLDVRDWLAARMPVRSMYMVMFYKQMSMMLRNGLTLLQALDIAGTTVGSRRLSAVIAQLRADIENGANLSGAMMRHSGHFDMLASQLVRGAEASGELDVVMERIARDLERKSDLQRQIITSLIYPAIVVLAAVGVSLFLVLGVVPKFAEFFAKSGRQLPAVTQNLIDFSNFMMAWGPWIGLLCLMAGVALITLWRRPESRPIVDRWVLRLPVVGNLITLGDMTRFAWTAGMLTRSGIPIVEALRVSADVLGNAAIAADVRHAAESVLSGRDLASSLCRPTLPPLIHQLSAVGERTGSLDAVLQEIGDFYQKLLEMAIKRMTALIEPVLIFLVAGMVGYVYYAFFAALFAAAG